VTEQAGHVETLRAHLTYEIYRAFGLVSAEWSHGLLDRLFAVPTQRLAHMGARFDHAVNHLGFAEAAYRALPHLVSSYRAYGVENVPAKGPLIVAANHPGTYDLLLIPASLGRDDIKIITGNIRFLRELPFTREHLIFLTPDVDVRVGVLRTAIRHLRSGGTLLIFPSGGIDPDPEVLPGSQEALRQWSPSVELILRRVPEAQVLVAIVSGVVASRYVHSPLTRLRKKAIDRRRIAELIQVAQQVIFDRRFTLVPRVSYAEPVTLADLRQAAGSSRATAALIDRAQRLLAQHVAAGASQAVPSGQ
jgi:hypothetical protein